MTIKIIKVVKEIEALQVAEKKKVEHLLKGLRQVTGRLKIVKESSSSKTFSKDSKSFSSSKYEKRPAPARRYRGDDVTSKESVDNKDEKNKLINKRNKQSDDHGVENKKRDKAEINSKNSEDVGNQIIREDLIEGRNAVIEALKSDRTIEYILIAKGDLVGSISVVLALAKEKGVVTKEVDRRKLDEMSQTSSHQGVMAIVTPYKYFGLERYI